MSTAAAVAYAVAAGAYAGFQLTVRFVVYPQFARVPPDAFAPYERAHQLLITPLVGVLFGALALTAAACVLAGPRGTGLFAAGLFAALLLVTGAGAVPQHNLLDERFDARLPATAGLGRRPRGSRAGAGARRRPRGHQRLLTESNRT